MRNAESLYDLNGDVGKITGASPDDGSIAVSFDGKEILYGAGAGT
jgi:hypothetical protein